MAQLKIALLADIHGNLVAFEAALDAIAHERPDQIACLGDVAATGPQPCEVVQRLRALGCPVVMGNADTALLDPPPITPETGDDLRKILEIDRWCAAQLDETDRAFIASFQPEIALSLGSAGALLCCHGSPRSFDDAILATTPDHDLATMVTGHDAAMIACGHTHVRMLRAFRGREIVNPGSVGLAYQFAADGSARVPPWAELAILTATDDAPPRVDFHRVPYDRAATLRAMRDRGMPHAAWWSADWQ